MVQSSYQAIGESDIVLVLIDGSKKSTINTEDIASKIVNKMKDSGILLSTDGPDHNVIKIKPPMIFNFQNACQLAETLDSILLKI